MSEEKKDKKKESFYIPNVILHWWERAYNNAHSANQYSTDGSNYIDSLKLSSQPTKKSPAFY